MKERAQLIRQLRRALQLLTRPADGDPIEFEIMDTTFEPFFDDEDD